MKKLTKTQAVALRWLGAARLEDSTGPNLGTFPTATSNALLRAGLIVRETHHTGTIVWALTDAVRSVLEGMHQEHRRRPAPRSPHRVAMSRRGARILATLAGSFL